MNFGKHENAESKYAPGSDVDSGDIFLFPYTTDEVTIEFIKEHGRIMFIIRGPPGTGKDSLTNMLVDCYSKSQIFSADSYFSNTFSRGSRDRGSLAASHDYCQKKVQSACIKGVHPIIVKNTNMKISEVQAYVNFAAEYNYTIIMAITTRKMKATPEVLAMSNTKGLSVDYFRKRLKQWQEAIPVNTGWFLNPEDSSYLLNQVQTHIDYLLGDGKFCRVFDVDDKGEILKNFGARKLLYCIAACGNNNQASEIRSYYLSDKVKEQYGQCFSIVIQGYIVTKSCIAAVVHLNETMKNLFIQESIPEFDDCLSSLMYSMSLNDNFMKHTSTVGFDDLDFTSNGKTNEEDRSEEYGNIDVKSCSFIILAERNELKEDAKQSMPEKLSTFFIKLLNEVADENGMINFDSFGELEDGYKYCRLSEDSWMIRPPTNLIFKTLFTGLYI
ncbi:2',3'-cyclic-nucleotide 3'-phosphodiesterase [Trichonephila inaurata madagascariensis]|uniref:2',3'-cyclic-nucleotide 3'-phosphodiesterase n=1 Tax=Trichonephila inaurata madagascariensis TaxID=2747483 RepID=A0A8X6XQX0_9ARAC|nr:2',3'-cyclic-nucleotide 3'-phosphodiesterase [Trichonephila inaurata madagascariensis]